MMQLRIVFVKAKLMSVSVFVLSVSFICSYRYGRMWVDSPMISVKALSFLTSMKCCPPYYYYLRLSTQRRASWLGGMRSLTILRVLFAFFLPCEWCSWRIHFKFLTMMWSGRVSGGFTVSSLYVDTIARRNALFPFSSNASQFALRCILIYQSG